MTFLAVLINNLPEILMWGGWTGLVFYAGRRSVRRSNNNRKG